MTSITRVSEFDVTALDALCAESVAEGYKIVVRLCDEWHSGVNRFGAVGEALFVAQSSTGILGVCGLNRDPYIDDASIGRVRHLYVRPSYRRQGIGRALVKAVMDAASIHFRTLRLRTTPAAESFYRVLGFQGITSGNEPTFILELDRALEPTASHRWMPLEFRHRG
jgi:GNAT superfamily N-acetyltransferase